MNYRQSAEDVLKAVGGRENVSKATHCVTRLRLILNNPESYDKEALENVPGAKGVFFNSGQLQIVFGPGAVENVYGEFIKITGLQESTVAEVKADGTENLNPLQRAFKIFSDIFVPIIPAFIGAAMITGLSTLLTTAGLFGMEGSLADSFPVLGSLSEMLSIIAATFTFIPVLVAWSATKRFGGNPVLGIVLGCVMVHPALLDANLVATGTVPEYWDFFGYMVPQVGFQGGVFAALLSCWFMAACEKWLQKKIPAVITFITVPALTLLLGGLGLFFVFGPIGNMLGSWLGSLTDFMYNTLGAFGAGAMAALLQPLTVTGTQHAIQGIEANLVAQTGFNYIQPLWSVSIIAQGGAAVGMFFLFRKHSKDRDIAMSSFIPTLFGVTEPAIFAVNLRNGIVPFLCGCVGAFVGGVFMKLLDVKAISFALTGIPGLTIVYPPTLLSYIIGELIAFTIPVVLVYALGKAGKINLGKQ